MFIAMNRFTIVTGKGEDFERVWKTRDTYLHDVPGIVRFALLRGDAEGDYVSHSTWASREAFLAWTQSEAFAAGHRQGSLAGILAGPPQVSLYEAVIAEEFATSTPA
jgi:heme-degrading monooxygenase HmoA